MNNPKNRKLQSIWNNSISYKDYIAQLEREQKKIDEDRKNKPDNLIKRIYSMDSGLITPKVFIIYWKELWDLVSGNPHKEGDISQYALAGSQFEIFTSCSNPVTGNHSWNDTMTMSAWTSCLGGWIEYNDISCFGKSSGKLEIIGTDDKSYKWYSKVEIVVNNTININPFSRAGASSILQCMDSVNRRLRSNSFLKTSGGYSSSYAGSIPIAWNCYIQIYDTLNISFREVGSGLYYVVTYLIKNLNTNYIPVTRYIETDWFNLNRNLYDDLKNYLFTYYGKNIEDNEYDIDSVLIRNYNNLSANLALFPPDSTAYGVSVITGQLDYIKLT